MFEISVSFELQTNNGNFIFEELKFYFIEL